MKTLPITTNVHKVVTHWNDWNPISQRYNHHLEDIDEEISEGLVKRLYNYAVKDIIESGFEPLLQGATVEIYTMNGDQPKNYREYNVRFVTEKGGYIELCRIMTKNGWPFLDFGYEISRG